MSFNTPVTDPQVGDRVRYRCVNLFIGQGVGVIESVDSEKLVTVRWRSLPYTSQEWCPNLMPDNI